MKTRLPHSSMLSLAAGMLAITLVLTACEESQFGLTKAQPGEPTTVELIEQEVERPDIFQTTDRGLWDGRPSLGGLWVAHVDTDQPERVIIINTTTGAEVKGALFRKELGNPGPPFQLSSSAAAALDILAGVPTEIRVTAIRRETVEVVTSAPAPEVAPAAEDAGLEGSTLEPITSSEILAVPTVPTQPKPKPARPTTPAEPEKLAEGEEPAAAEQPVTEEPGVAEVPVATEVATFAEGTAIPARPYVQVATLSTAERADALVARLEKAGLSAARKPSGSGETVKYIVIVGPAATENKARDNLKKVRGMGFKDSFPSRGL